jgi:hypothetical protein
MAPDQKRYDCMAKTLHPHSLIQRRTRRLARIPYLFCREVCINYAELRQFSRVPAAKLALEALARWIDVPLCKADSNRRVKSEDCPAPTPGSSATPHPAQTVSSGFQPTAAVLWRIMEECSRR